MPCTVIVTLTPLPNNSDAVADAIHKEIPEIRRAAGCETYELYRRVDGAIVLVENWSTRQAWQDHFGTDAIGRLREVLTPLLALPAERWEMYREG